MTLTKFFKRKNHFPNATHIVELAFTCGGIDYFTFEDIFNLPYQRALQALVYYREVSLNCTHEYLQAHVNAVKNALTPTTEKNTIDVNYVYMLNRQLEQRLQLPPDTELLYKLASVVYFDQNEKPETYEFSYGAKKIEHWKKSATAKDFFLQKPLLELLPFLKQSAENLNTFQQMNENIKKKHWESVLQNLSDEQKKTLVTSLG